MLYDEPLSIPRKRYSVKHTPEALFPEAPEVAKHENASCTTPIKIQIKRGS
jgi:hypothetical protein